MPLVSNLTVAMELLFLMVILVPFQAPATGTSPIPRLASKEILQVL